MATQYPPPSEARRNAVRTTRRNGQPILNGIDFLEVVSADQQTLAVHFIHPLPGAANGVPAGAAVLQGENIRIEGGERIRQIEVVGDPQTTENILTVTVNMAGDFSPYVLRLVTSADNPLPPAGFDPLLSLVPFSFKAECLNELDCRSESVCPSESLPEPEIDYLAKDYASFRRLMLDRMAVLMPEWRERNPADVGVALVELLAYAADYLSYKQDAIATEAYLDTARRRVSVGRHASLVDYRMHDGCNARAWVQIRVNADVETLVPGQPPLPQGSQLLTRAVGLPSRLSPQDQATLRQALSFGSEVFETMHTVAALYVDHNEMPFYTWGEPKTCLPRGATHATLRGSYSHLKPGDVLILVEAKGPDTGEPEDADPAHRHAVRLIDVEVEAAAGVPLTDPLTEQPITEITWHSADALPFPLCLAAGTEIQDVSLALGNIVLVDHGRTIEAPERLGVVPRPTLVRLTAGSLPSGSLAAQAADANQRRLESVPSRFRPTLKQAPLTQAAPYPYRNDETLLQPAAAAFDPALHAVRPAITELTSQLNGITSTWEPQADLLNSSPNRREYVAEVEADGRATLRFGDGRYGFRPTADMEFTAIYRIGNGVRGNVGQQAIGHIVSDVVEIEAVGNPLPAAGGIDPESMEQVRQYAPHAFRTQARAVTPADYAEIASRHPQVQRVAASLGWTGSWYTVFLTVDRLGGLPIDAEFEAELRRYLEPYRMTGHDLEVNSPRFVPLDIEMQVCVEPDYFRSEVKTALLQVFSNRTLPDGRLGFFHPDRFSFGQPVFLSPLYAAAEAIAGVASVKITRFQRQNAPGSDALKKGQLTLGRLEIARLDNDLNFLNRGIFQLIVEGGK